jgi:FixJ family two-component response regulator
METDMDFVEHFSAGLSQAASPTSRTPPNVYVVDDDVSVLELLELLILNAGWQPHFSHSAEEFLARPRVLAPSCLILDVNLPKLNGLELQKRLLGRTELPVIFLTRYGSVPMTVQAMKAGAVEFLTKPFDDEALLNAMRHAFELSHAALCWQAEHRSLRDRYASLTLRERQVMALVVSGKSNKQVGGELGITEITVKVHRGSMMRKMNASSLACLVNIGLRLQLPSLVPVGQAARQLRSALSLPNAGQMRIVPDNCMV